MTMTWIRPVQLGLGAVALCMASWAGAQTAAPADGAAPPPAAPMAHKHKHSGKHHGEKAKHHKKHADPAQREAAAAREDARQGKTPRTQEEQLRHNAVARCDVFKSEGDRHACVERVRNGQVSGSVKDGGTITEYTEQVPVR